MVLNAKWIVPHSHISIDFYMNVPTEYKMTNNDIEKKLLRLAFSNDLPNEMDGHSKLEETLDTFFLINIKLLIIILVIVSMILII